MNNLIHAALALACIAQASMLPATASPERTPAVAAYSALPAYLKDAKDLTHAQQVELCLLIVKSQNSFACDPDGDIVSGRIDAWN